MIEKGEMDLLRKYVSGYNLLLALGAFYMGTSILLGEGIFGEFPPEWTGRMPFNSWESLALFGIVVFGVGTKPVLPRVHAVEIKLAQAKLGFDVHG